MGRVWLPGKWSWCITGGIIYIKFTKQEWSIQCLSEHGKIIGKIEEGFRDVGTVRESGHHPIIYCPPPTDPLRCIRSEEGLWSGNNYISRGQSRIGFIILSLGKCLLFLYLVYMTKKISFRYVHYKELRLLAPFENSCVLQWINNEFPPKELFFFSPQVKLRCWKAPLGNLFIALLTMKCRELKINSIEIINALQSVDYQLVKINTTDYPWIMHINIYNILGNEFIKINNNYNNRDLVLKFPYISQILKGIFFSELILWYNLTGVRTICIAALATFISF